jgi:oligoribonuclease
MKYVSVDIETTGLDPVQHDILEFAAVLDDTLFGTKGIPQGPSVEQMPFFRAVIVEDDYTVTPYCGRLHFDLWKEICAVDKTRLNDEGHYVGHYNKNNNDIEDPACRLTDGAGVKTHYTKPEYFIGLFIEWLESQGITESISPAGKNFGAFDLQFLKQYAGGDDLPFKHRTLDPGCMYATATDEVIPSLEECLKRAGLTPDALHTALGDARDVVRLIRYKLQISKE